MGTKDPRVDAYIAASAEFARPILTHLRAVIHRACPSVEESMKWSMPAFTYHGLLCGMAAFKQHCTFSFWKGDLVVARTLRARTAMGQFGRITSVDDLPSGAVLSRLVKKAMRLNESGVTRPTARGARAARPEPEVPDDLHRALARHPRARTTFEEFSPSHRREYIEWLVEAKRPETRQRRLATMVGWMEKGKARNWRYERA